MMKKIAAGHSVLPQHPRCVATDVRVLGARQHRGAVPVKRIGGIDGDEIELPGRNDPKVDVLRLVRNWLCDETNGPWVMVLDNADDVETFFPSQQLTQNEPSGGSPASLTNLPPSKSQRILSLLHLTIKGCGNLY